MEACLHSSNGFLLATLGGEVSNFAKVEDSMVLDSIVLSVMFLIFDGGFGFIIVSQEEFFAAINHNVNIIY